MPAGGLSRSSLFASAALRGGGGGGSVIIISCSIKNSGVVTANGGSGGSAGYGAGAGAAGGAGIVFIKELGVL